MVRGGGYMEARKRVSDIRWGWAVAQINNIVNEQIERIDKNDKLTPEVKAEKIDEAERAWQRIMQG